MVTLLLTIRLHVTRASENKRVVRVFYFICSSCAVLLYLSLFYVCSLCQKSHCGIIREFHPYLIAFQPDKLAQWFIEEG